MQQKDVAIVGAGLVGSLLGIYLKEKGHTVSIYERRPDMRKLSLDGGRSINLALSDRGWKALEQVGLKEPIREIAIPMYRRVMHDQAGELSFQAYGKDNQAIYSVSRSGLNARLMNLCEEHGVEIRFDQRCTDVDLEQTQLSFKGPKAEKYTVKPDLIFGADGAFSAVRGRMQKTDRFNYSQEYIEHGYKELEIPANPDGTHRLEREALHIWPRGQYMLIALPNMNGSFTCTLFFPYEGKPGFNQLTSPTEARRFFQEQFADALALMPDFDEQWTQNPTSSLVIIRCYPWVKNKTALIGDASHAIVPFYGQGMNSGFEDCDVLNQMMERFGDDWSAILEAFQQERKPNADAIADLAMRNFVEMRDLTGREDFLLQKKIEAKFSSAHPEKWLPLYSMVTFSHIPYAEALAEGRKQDAIMREVMSMAGIEKKWDSDEVERLMLDKLRAFEA